MAFAVGGEGLFHNRFDTVREEVARFKPRRVIGHSLGGAVASQYTGKRVGGHKIETVGYDPYILPWRGQVDHAYSDAMDPVSVLSWTNDRAPLGRDGRFWPHSLSTLA